MQRASVIAVVLVSVAVLITSGSWAEDKPPAELPPQTLLLPGLYLFQTRTREGSCDDAERTGYVTSGVATLDGVPGARSVKLQLLSSKYWPTWTLTIAADDLIVGTAIMGGGKDEAAGTSRFEARA